MLIKIYDKIVELVGREGTKPVGSRIGRVVGAVQNHENKIRRA